MLASQNTKSLGDYPLLIKNLLHTPLLVAPDQEIVSSRSRRYNYRTLKERIGRLASGLTSIGVAMGNTVGVMDWDSHRYLECFFGVPMMGGVLHTINVRLSVEQILYTINHAEDDVILVHVDFLPIIEAIALKIERPVKIILIQDDPAKPAPDAGQVADYESLLAASDSNFAFADFDESTQATTFLHKLARPASRKGWPIVIVI